MSTARPQCKLLHQLFTGRPERTERARKSPALPNSSLHLGMSPFHRAPSCQKEKKTLPGTQATVTGFERVTAQHFGYAVGILTRHPFGNKGDRNRPLKPIRTALGPSHSRPNDVHGKPFPTSALKVFI